MIENYSGLRQKMRMRALEVFAYQANRKFKNTIENQSSNRGELSNFRADVRWCLLAHYPPFRKDLKYYFAKDAIPHTHLREKDCPCKSDVPCLPVGDSLKWGVRFEFGDPPDPKILYNIADVASPIQIPLYKGFGIHGLTKFPIRSEWLNAIVAADAPLDDIILGIKVAREEWHKLNNASQSRAGRPKKEDLGFHGKEPSSVNITNINGKLVSIEIRISARLSRIEEDLKRELKNHLNSKKRSGRTRRFTPDRFTLKVLRIYCRFGDTKKIKKWFRSKTKKRKYGKLGELVCSRIPAILSFVDPKNIGQYPDHPLSKKIKQTRYVDNGNDSWVVSRELNRHRQI